jgi:hypothetical protein
MSQFLRYFMLLPAALVVSVIFQNCGQAGQISKISTAVEGITQTPTDDNDNTNDVYVIRALASTQFICSPFGNNNQGNATSGLRAELAYINPSSNLSDEMKRSYGVRDYFNGANQFIKTPTTLFLTQINAPTQNFDQGFLLSNNTYLSNGSGERLIEWFALHLQSLLKLSPQDDEGEYEFATISDDGSRVFVGSPLREIVNNDGVHTVKMMCSTEALQFNRDTKLPLSYYYNQGPRTEIANVFLWRRKLNNAQSGNYKHCGKSDRMRFWNPANSSAGEYVQDILADGWKVIGANNFELPGSQVNPCTTQNTNLISSAEFSALTNGSTRLDLVFANAANIRANLFKLVGADKVQVQSFDLSAQMRDRVSLEIQGLENSQTYSIEVLLEMAGSGTQVLNEVRFELAKE